MIPISIHDHIQTISNIHFLVATPTHDKHGGISIILTGHISGIYCIHIYIHTRIVSLYIDSHHHYHHHYHHQHHHHHHHQDLHLYVLTTTVPDAAMAQRIGGS